MLWMKENEMQMLAVQAGVLHQLACTNSRFIRFISSEQNKSCKAGCATYCVTCTMTVVREETWMHAEILTFIFTKIIIITYCISNYHYYCDPSMLIFLHPVPLTITINSNHYTLHFSLLQPSDGLSLTIVITTRCITFTIIVRLAFRLTLTFHWRGWGKVPK